MKKVLLALLLELIPSGLMIALGAGILNEEEVVAGPARLLTSQGLTREAAGWLVILLAAGTAMVTMGRLIPLLRHMWLGKALEEGGIRQRGVIVDMRSCKVIRVNQTTSVRLTIRCTTPMGRELEFKSPVVWAPESRIGDPVEVIFDPVDETRYCMRLLEKNYVRSSLKEQGRRRVP